VSETIDAEHGSVPPAVVERDGTDPLRLLRLEQSFLGLVAVLGVADVDPPAVKGDGVDGAAALDEEVDRVRPTASEVDESRASVNGPVSLAMNPLPSTGEPTPRAPTWREFRHPGPARTSGDGEPCRTYFQI
jgi:hypothetical protein